MSKSSNIRSMSMELSIIDENLRKVKKIDTLPFTTIVIKNASDQREEIVAWAPLKKALKVFLIDYFKKEKQEIYLKMEQELKNNKDED